MSSSRRFVNKTYTDADLVVLYMKYREAKIGPFVREVGDFIAHPNRNRGATLESTIYKFAQFSFFIKYQSDRSEPFTPFGDCDWWLMPYFNGKIKHTAPNDLMTSCGLSKSQAYDEVRRWFPGKDPYPKRIECTNLVTCFQMTDFFCKQMTHNSVFKIGEISGELKKIFNAEGIPLKELPNFIVGTMVMLSGRSCEVFPGFVATLNLYIHPNRFEEDKTRPIPEGAKYINGRFLPDGDLQLQVTTSGQFTLAGRVALAHEFLNYKIDTEEYVSRDLVIADSNNMPKLDFNRKLTFERYTTPMVFECAK